jgi:UDP-N-acetylglucosamine acyltransferase
MPTIHSSAVIHPSAQIAEGVRIGPYSIIGPDVSIGPGTVIEAHARIDSNTRIGAECHISSFAVLGSDPQDLSYKGHPTYAIIGDRNRIREYVTINRGCHGEGITRLGSDCMLMTGVHIAHDCQVGSNVIMANLATLGGHVQVGDRVVMGGLCAVHQFVRIGRMVMIGGTAGIMQDVPPFSMAQGMPATLRGLNMVGMRRNGITRENALAEVREAVPRSPEVMEFIGFLEAPSKRGFARAELKELGKRPFEVVGGEAQAGEGKPETKPGERRSEDSGSRP